jgi:predicted transcriptional regulator
MIITSQRITIVRHRIPVRKNINEELQWFGNALGLFNLRDKDKSCFRIFIELIKSAKKNIPLTSDEIAEKLALSRGTVIHHMNKLMESGIVIHEQNKYMLRVDNLETLIEEIKKDLNRTMDDLKQVAENIDKWLEL